MDAVTQLGMVGLGRLGGALAQQALGKGLYVAGYDPAGADDELASAGVDLVDRVSRLRQRLEPPRIIFVSVPAGSAIDQLLAQLTPSLDRGDVVIDGGNSYWGDSVRRYRRCRDEHGIHFIDVGTSGGVHGARTGANFTVGGTAEQFELVAPLLQKLAVPGGVVHCGSPGSGHYVKLVHNGIEFGMLQAIGEGVHMLEAFREDLPVQDILDGWTHGSVIRSWLLELLAAEYRRQEGSGGVSDYVEDTGEVNWLVEDAMRMEVPVPVISQSVMQLFSSRDQSATWARVVAMMRRGFGEFDYGASPVLAQYRRGARVGPWLDAD
ncbi:NADP-dependent phosphogluconate dehydrogenase [Gilvimarinus sp. F26214L]|uniref:NADP-dependent phosphogluconate dehydrogenase n=1 Tax=Gilvimarinus sp. DZF01 TaxID=3461371 RepID=UPI00404637B6